MKMREQLREWLSSLGAMSSTFMAKVFRYTMQETYRQTSWWMRQQLARYLTSNSISLSTKRACFRQQALAWGCRQSWLPPILIKRIGAIQGVASRSSRQAARLALSSKLRYPSKSDWLIALSVSWTKMSLKSTKSTVWRVRSFSATVILICSTWLSIQSGASWQLRCTKCTWTP